MASEGVVDREKRERTRMDVLQRPSGHFITFGSSPSRASAFLILEIYSPIPDNAAEKNRDASTNFYFTFFFIIYMPHPSPPRNDKLPDCIRNIQGARCVPGVVLSIFFHPTTLPPATPFPAPMLFAPHYIIRRKNSCQRSRTRVASKVLA
ncbi:hypothetical protein QTP88_012942 [Uroleucon formosanum]